MKTVLNEFQEKYDFYDILDFSNKNLNELAAIVIAKAIQTSQAKMSCTGLCLRATYLNKLETFIPFLTDTSIKYLDFSENLLEDEGFEYLLLVLGKQLERLDIRACGIKSIPIQSVEKCKSLKRLEISKNRIGSKGLNSLLEAVYLTLEQLTAVSCGITEINEDLLKKCKFLKTLDIEDNPIGNSGFDCIVRSCFMNLEEICALDCKITSINSFFLGKCQKLVRINLSYNEIGDDGLDSILSSLKGNKLEKLSIVNCGIQRFSRHDLFETCCVYLNHLSLLQNPLISEEIDFLLYQIRFFPNLKTLWLDDSRAEDLMKIVNSQKFKLQIFLCSICSLPRIGSNSFFRLLSSSSILQRLFILL